MGDKKKSIVTIAWPTIHKSLTCTYKVVYQLWSLGYQLSVAINVNVFDS